MSIGTIGKKVKVVLDTNIVISALVFGGKPKQILQLAVDKKIQVVVSGVLLAELADVVNKKFPVAVSDLQLFHALAKKRFLLVNPSESVSILADNDDNRILEAAIEGECQFIVTGDRELLALKAYQGVNIVTADEFLSEFEKNQNNL